MKFLLDEARKFVENVSLLITSRKDSREFMLEATTKSIWSSKLCFLSEKIQGILLVMSVATLLDLSLNVDICDPSPFASFASFPSPPGEVAVVFSSTQLASDHVSLFSRLLLYSKANVLHKCIERTRRD